MGGKPCPEKILRIQKKKLKQQSVHQGKKARAFAAAVPKTIPIMMGFLFLGMSYGIYMKVSGFSFVYPLCMSLVIFGGSLEFVAVTMLPGAFAPLQTFLVALMIQARHLFYGIALLEKYRGTGWKKPYLIFGMCDESFSINCSAEVPEDVDKGWFCFIYGSGICCFPSEAVPSVICYWFNLCLIGSFVPLFQETTENGQLFMERCRKT